MMKYILSLVAYSLLFVSLAFAKTVEVNSGNWVFDKQRLLVINEFDYTEVNSKVGSRSSNWAEFISNSALETLSYWRCQINRGKKREKT